MCGLLYFLSPHRSIFRLVNLLFNHSVCVGGGGNTNFDFFFFVNGSNFSISIVHFSRGFLYKYNRY